MSHCSKPLFIFVATGAVACIGPSTAWAQTGTITKEMQTSCTNDCKKFCGDYGLQTSALNLCMRKADPSLLPACVRALVHAGKVSQAKVDKVKVQANGR